MENIASVEVQKFLDELTALSIKHGIIIGGCGCCGSPDLTEEKRKGKYRCTAPPPYTFLEFVVE